MNAEERFHENSETDDRDLNAALCFMAARHRVARIGHAANKAHATRLVQGGG